MRPPDAATLAQKRREHLGYADTALWERADARNPDPARFVPVQVTGFEALQARRQKVQAMSDAVHAQLGKTRDALKTIADQRDQQMELRLKALRERQGFLKRRLLELMVKLDVPPPDPRTGADPPLNATERQWASGLTHLAAEVRGDERLRQLQTLRAKLDRLQAEGTPESVKRAAAGLNLGDLEVKLERQQNALLALIDVQKRDAKDATIALDEVRRATGATES